MESECGDIMGEYNPRIENATWFRRIIKTVFFLYLLSKMASSINVSTTTANEAHAGGKWKVQFFYAAPLHESIANESDTTSYEPTFLELNAALRKFNEASQGTIRQLSMSYEVASRTEELLFMTYQGNIGPSAYNKTVETKLLSREIEQKISKVAELLEHNSFILESLLKPFTVTFGLTRFTSMDSSTSPKSQLVIENTDTFLDKSSELMQPLARYIPPYKPTVNDNESEDHSYEDASQIIAHITRDWTSSGAPIREITYDWVVEQLLRYHRQLEMSSSQSFSPVLVPGAGLSRLAFDIAFLREDTFHQSEITEHDNKHYYPFEVEAVDCSLVMASAAYHILNNVTSDPPRKIYPFVMDPFTNEVETERRWESMMFPEMSVIDTLQYYKEQKSWENAPFQNDPSLSYTIGDFVAIYASRAKQQMYGSIATCYFLDTATNIYEYILTIKNLLRPGGLWINVGPVQWHRNAQLQPSVNELRQIIQLFGFKIHYWSVEDRLVGYRHPDDVLPSFSGSRYTRSEGYRPLKFVASHQSYEPLGDLLPLIESLRLSTGRKSMLHEAWNTQSKDNR